MPEICLREMFPILAKFPSLVTELVSDRLGSRDAYASKKLGHRHSWGLIFLGTPLRRGLGGEGDPLNFSNIFYKISVTGGRKWLQFLIFLWSRLTKFFEHFFTTAAHRAAVVIESKS